MKWFLLGVGIGAFVVEIALMIDDWNTNRSWYRSTARGTAGRD